MRKLKVIYLIPIFVVLTLGLAAGGYYVMIVPQITATKKAKEDWVGKKKACDGLEAKWQQAIDARKVAADKLWNEHYQFASIQAKMPDVHHMKNQYPNAEQGLRALYALMGTPRLANELRKWANRFRVDGVPDFKFEGMLGFEETLPAVEGVGVDFGTQHLWGRGYPDLISQVQRMSGFDYCPLVVEPAGGKIEITVHRDHPKHTVQKPILTMDITCKGYFLTHDWDPLGDANAVKGMLDKANQIHMSTETPEKMRTTWSKDPGECPKVLGLLSAIDLGIAKSDELKP